MRVRRELGAAALATLGFGLAGPAAARADLPPPAPRAAVGAKTPRAPGSALPTPSPPATSPTPPAGATGGAATPGTTIPGPVLGSDPNAQNGSLGGPGPLVANGLGSPTCRDARARAQISAAARGNCATSGVAESQAPLQNYQFDVHIDTGLTGFSPLRLVQDLLLTPVWMAVVWLTHVAVVALEWCFSLDLLGSSTLDSVTRGLQAMRDALTTPWLGPVLALAAIAVLYNGIVRRRVVDTLGQVALLLTMMSCGLWLIADPAGTVGAASGLANEASLGALGAAATGDPNHPLRSLDDALRPLFATAVTGPWCYLEFGNVAWCREPGRLDPALVAAARAVVAHDRAAASTAAQRRTVAVEADEVGRATTNGDLFLALPSDGPRRNSINADAANPSLLRTLCGSDTATSCSAATGPQAEFRTDKGTWARLGGLLLIVIGATGMFAVIGFICLRLIGAALLALLYLLLAPVVVLAPAVGDAGRDAFRRWALRLLGAVIAKLVYAVFLGVVLLMVRVLAELGALGWWTQWLLLSVFWWLVFANRHRVLENVIHERAEQTRRGSLANRLFATRQAIKLATPSAKAARSVVRRGSERLRHLSERVGRGAKLPEKRRHEAALAEQVVGTLETDHVAAAATVARASAIELELGEQRIRLDRLRGARGRAVGSGDRRRAVSLQRRERAVGGRIDAAERELAAARAAVPVGAENRRRTGLVHDAAQRSARAEWLDHEAELRPLLAPATDRRTGRRDYANLAPLTGLTQSQYAGLGEAARRRTRLVIDRKLEKRRELANEIQRLTSRAAPHAGQRRRPPGPPPDPRPPRRQVSHRERQFARRPSHDEGDSRPRRRRPASADDPSARGRDRFDR